MKDIIVSLSAIAFVVLVNYFVLSSRDIYILAIFAIVTYMVGAYVAKSARRSMKRVKYFVVFFLALFVFQTILNSQIGIQKNITNSLTTVLQIAIISEMMMIIVSLVSLSSIFGGLFFLPRGVRLLITMTFSYIPFLTKEYERISIAQKSRGMGNTLLSQVTIAFSVIVPLVHRVFAKSQDLALVLSMRGWGCEKV